jgi:16S rRNA (adenine1518-N6/adenine1519-N6)-dimethyltransferase
MEKINPLKNFGQNYLLDKNILNKIADEINPSRGDNILEIGPGLGALSGEILKRTDSLTAVEIDRRVIDALKEQFENLNVIQGDILETDLKNFASSGNKLRVVGNIPYNITSPILFKLIEDRNIISDAVFMIQHEVAKRITSSKGTKDYGILSVVLNYFCDIKYCFKVSPNVFFPKPKVDSAVIHLWFNTDKYPGLEDERLYIQTVKAAFGKRRKTLKNSLSSSRFGDIDFTKSEVDLSLRAEQLSIEDFILLTNFIRREIYGRKQE